MTLLTLLASRRQRQRQSDDQTEPKPKSAAEKQLSHGCRSATDFFALGFGGDQVMAVGAFLDSNSPVPRSIRKVAKGRRGVIPAQCSFGNCRLSCQ